MGPALRKYLGVAAEYRGELAGSVNEDVAVVFGQALVDYATSHPVTDGGILVNLLEELVTMDMPGAALRMYEAHRSIFPVRDFRAQFHLGNAAMLAGSLVLAEQAFAEAQKLVPAETAPYVNMAQILIHDDRLDEARKWIEAGLHADANHFGLWDMLAWVSRELEIPDHTKSIERLAREMNSWAGLCLCTELIAPEEPERKLAVLEEFYGDSQSSSDFSADFIVEFTAVLGQCGLYERIAPVIWRFRSAQSAAAADQVAWKLQLHLAQAQIATGQIREAAESIEALGQMSGVPDSVTGTIIPALLDEIKDATTNQPDISGMTTGAKNERH